MRSSSDPQTSHPPRGKDRTRRLPNPNSRGGVECSQGAGPRNEEMTRQVTQGVPRPREAYRERRDSSQPLRLSVGWLSPPGTGNEVHKVVVNSERDPVHQNQTARRFPTAVPRNWIRSGALQGRRRNRIQRLQHPPDQMHAMADGVLDASLQRNCRARGRASVAPGRAELFNTLPCSGPNGKWIRMPQGLAGAVKA